MINAVSSFFPASISSSFPAVQRSGGVSQQSSVFKSAASAQPASITGSTFADKLPAFFSLSPSGFSAVFSDAGSPQFFGSLFSQMASRAYTQSNLLMANRLSLTA